MNLKKFELLLKNESIWFNKLNNFSDLHEGRALVDWENKDVQITDRWREKFVCNCWNCDQDENFALWNIYLGKSNKGICIVSSRDDFMNSIINKKENIKGYFINYEKYGRALDEISPLDTVTTKYEWYSYENEFRFIKYLKKENSVKGIDIKIQPRKLIKEIILCPNMKASIIEEVHNLCLKYKISTSIIKSSIIRDKL